MGAPEVYPPDDMRARLGTGDGTDRGQSRRNLNI